MSAPGSQDLPFLVTHWLANLNASNLASQRSSTNTNAGDADQQQALERIRAATAEIASAFSTLGAFGTAIQPSFGSSFARENSPQNATYSDIRRRWNGLSPSHLEYVAQAVVAANTVTETTASSALDVNLVEAAGEKREQNAATQGGRTAQDAIDIEESTFNEKREGSLDTQAGQSILHAPVLMGSTTATSTTKVISSLDTDRETQSTLPSIPTQSSYAQIGRRTAVVVRELCETRANMQTTQQEMTGLHKSLAKQAATLDALNEKYRRLSQNADMTKLVQVSDEVKAGKQDCERVTAQLNRKLTDLTKSLEANHKKFGELQEEAKSLEMKRKAVVRGFHDPFGSFKGPLAPGHRIGGNPLMRILVGRQQGLTQTRNPQLSSRSSILQGSKDPHFAATRKALLSSRLSHAVTINAHLQYPVYCLRFDRTGRYFITGADDYLVKLFYLGAGKSCRDKNPADGSRLLRCNYGANMRGAVLVCSLRGHAGVINDIDVSTDNAFLATASVDGDVRIWGLKDGSPVAILRGHKGGANMVCWSKLTPYRIVTTAADGFARVWDIREACLKRYNSQIGKREEYRIQLSPSERENSQSQSANATHEASLPPLPAREDFQVARPPAAAQPALPAVPAPPQNENQLVVPPLPPGVAPLPGAESNNNAAAQAPNGANPVPPGQFVANDEIDEGVKLLCKYKHGSTGPDLVGPGTRSRRSAVNVICVARCPLGGYFATGSDDGVCRVYRDQEDEAVAIVDRRVSDSIEPRKRAHNMSISNSQISDQPALELKGHVGAITDLSYSHAGDRILSASQKDGVVRIWALSSLYSNGNEVGDGGVNQVVFKLTNPSSASSRTQRRAPGGASRSEASKVSCDVAFWTHDDSRIITSQCVLIKQSGTEIQPGSQYLFLWDSRSGHCLMGIAGAHSMQCPVIVPHPTDASLMCSAGADGIAKVWDWESGKCLLTHKNSIEFGPIEGTNKDKLAGYLDGAFSPDGTKLVLTDDSGRLTILDSTDTKTLSTSLTTPSWMTEQYFANDYYELYYDQSGYCIERGSERPPHLAPRGVRCNHTGSPWSDEVGEAFSKLVGPSPLSSNICRWEREAIRNRDRKDESQIAVLSEATGGVKARRVVHEYDPSTTIILKAAGHIEDNFAAAATASFGNTDLRSTQTASSRSEASASNTNSQSLSSNYRYLDYDDMLREQGIQDDGEVDTDDEDFNQGAAENSEESDDDMDLEDELRYEVGSPYRASSRRRSDQSNTERRQRSQRRAQRQNSQFIEVDSDDENMEQYVSTNKTPSGPYVDDYHIIGHFWMMTGSNSRVRRKWLKRIESDTSYEGRKIYTPQVGDSVVYIARAHYETTSDFPSLEPPWQRWPQGTAWPVVRCSIRGVRYRFPYEDYYRASQSMCNSVVAILTMEVTGIPEISADREFPWPKPTFVDSTRPFVFEVSLFENDKSEFIFPEGLYTERLRALESCLRERDNLSGLPVNVYFDNQSRAEDATMQSYEGQVSGFVSEDSPSNPHLSGSGFQVIKVQMENYIDLFGPWEIAMADLSISRPHLSEEDTQLVRDNLNLFSRKAGIAEHFNMDVDTVRYCDYDRMVEVSMNLMFMKRRLQNDYYASKISVASDLRLIRSNCTKYNGQGYELTAVLDSMCNDFENNVLTEEERSFMITEEEFKRMSTNSREAEERTSQTIRLRLRQRTNQVNVHDHQPVTSRNTRRLRRQSSLENLPPPLDAEEPQVSTRRRGLRSDTRVPMARTRSSINDDSNANGSTNNRRSLRGRGRVTLESLSRLGDDPEAVGNSTGIRTSQNSRLRSANRSNTQNSGGTQPPQLSSRSMRAMARNQREETDTPTEAGADVLPGSRSQSTSRPSPRTRRNNTRQAEPPTSEDDFESEAEVDSDDDSALSDVASEEDDEMDEAEFSLPPRGRSTRRQSSPSRASPRNKRKASSPANESPSRRSSRRKENPQSYEDVPSDFELEDEEQEESEEEVPRSRSRSRQAPSYEEVPSDFNDEDSEEETPAPRATSRKRKANSGAGAQSSRKKKATEMPTVQLTEWPSTEPDEIALVCTAMVDRLTEADSLQLFGVPVLESFPEIADQYLQIIDTPMDFRTIAEDRIHEYQDVRALQKDLILVFENCCKYNGFDSEFGEYATGLWKQLNEMFANVCKELDVMLPRRWRP